MARIEADWIFEKHQDIIQFFKVSSLAQNLLKFGKMLLQCGLSSRHCFKS